MNIIGCATTKNNETLTPHESEFNYESAPAFMLTPHAKESLPGYKEGVFCPKAPIRAICLSEPDFRYLKKEERLSEMRKIELKENIEQKFDWTSFYLGGAAGSVIITILFIVFR